jgi:serine/threonine protein kinase
VCESNKDCVSGLCKTHCCAQDTPDDCSACGINDPTNFSIANGECYVPLALVSSWDPASLATGWLKVYNKDERTELASPPSDFVESMLTNTKDASTGKKSVRFRLLWGSLDRVHTEYNKGTPPKTGMVPGGEGFDPGLFDVDEKSGKISALPRRNGNYSVFLVADDGAGTASEAGLSHVLDQVIVKRWDFTVTGKPDFMVESYSREQHNLPPTSKGEDPYITKKAVGNVKCVVGTMYHIAPINTSTLVYAHASGGKDAAIRFTIRHPPPGFFIEPNTGEIQGNPQASSVSKTFTSTLLALDPAGQEAVIETMTFTIFPKPQFIPVFETVRTATSAVDSTYTDPTAVSIDQLFVVGTSYKIATFILNKTTTMVSAGDVDDVTYTLSSNAPKSFFAQARSGDIFGTFPAAGEYSFALLVVDQGGEVAVAEQFEIVVLPRPKFTVEVGDSRIRTGPAFTDPATFTPFTVNQSYRFSRLELVESGTTVSAGTIDDVTYTLDATDGWFVSAQTGEIFGQFGVVGDHTMHLYAVDAAGKQASVEQLTFSVQERPKFNVMVDSERSRLGAEYTDPSDVTLTVVADESYRFSPMILNKNGTTVSSGTFEEITFTLVAADGWFVSPHNGEIFGQFESSGNQSMTLFAVDASGARQLIETMDFDVQSRSSFNLFLRKDANNNTIRSNSAVEGYTDPSSMSGAYVAGSSYKIARLEIDPGLTTVSSGTLSDVSYTLSADAPSTFFVQASTGVIFGQFDNPGLYSFSLLAVDRTGQTAEMERYVFDVIARVQFVLGVKEESRIHAGGDYTDPLQPQSAIIINESYKFAPLVLDHERTTVSLGAFEDITFTLVAADGWFVSAHNGEIFGQFQSLGRQRMSLFAVDASGARQLVETMDFDVQPRPKFVLGLKENATVRMHRDDITNGYTSPESMSEYIVGDSYKIARLEIDPELTTVSSGSLSDVSYTLSADAPSTFFVQASTGVIFGQFENSGAHAFSLLAVDRAGQIAVVERYRFNVVDPSQFALGTNATTLDVSWSDVGFADKDGMVESALVQYAVGSTVKFPPLAASKEQLFVHPAFDDFSKVTYKQTFDQHDGNNPGLWLVDTETGMMLAQPDHAGNYTVHIEATDGAGIAVVVRSWFFEVLLRDTEVAAYGPNGKSCQNNGASVDGIVFDQRFVCDCSATLFDGENCERATQVIQCEPDFVLVGNECKTFVLHVGEARVVSGKEFTDPVGNQDAYYTVGAPYRIAPLTIDDMRTVYSYGNQSDVTYTMSGDTEGFFLNTVTGQMLGTFSNFDEDKTSTKTYSLTLKAIDASGLQQNVETLIMHVRYPDIEVDEYGPNKRPCENNATRVDGADNNGNKFDQSFSCRCIVTATTSFFGSNCEQIVSLEDQASTTLVESTGNTPLVAALLMGGMLVILAIALAVYKRRMNLVKMMAFDFEAEVSRLILAGEIDADDAACIPREIKRSHVTMLGKVGEGAFGEVWKAMLCESSAGGVAGYAVASKIAKEGDGRGEMLREATVMAQVPSHPNLVSLIGVVTSGSPLLLLLSFCEKGSLLSMLKADRTKLMAGQRPIFSLADKCKMVLNVASGMEHLTANLFVHRDLAARNVLLSSECTCQVGDFGLARGTAGAKAGDDNDDEHGEQDYYRSRTGTFPVRWTAPEAMQTMRFSEGSDVWSFGITLVEVFTNGDKPYAKLDNAAVISQVQSGYRAQQPKECTDEMYKLMLQCWSAKETDRPTFAQLVLTLTDISASATKHAQSSVSSTTRRAKIDNAFGDAFDGAFSDDGQSSGDSEAEEATYLDTSPEKPGQGQSKAKGAPAAAMQMEVINNPVAGAKRRNQTSSSSIVETVLDIDFEFMSVVAGVRGAGNTAEEIVDLEI